MAGGRSLLCGDDGMSVAERALAYWRHARVYYRKNGQPTGSIPRIRVAARTLRTTYGSIPAKMFGPLALQAIQRPLAESGKSRRYLNYLVETIKTTWWRPSSASSAGVWPGNWYPGRSTGRSSRCPVSARVTRWPGSRPRSGRWPNRLSTPPAGVA